MDVEILRETSALKKIIIGIALEGAEDFKVSLLQRDVTVVRIKCLCCKSADRIKNDLSKWCGCLRKFVQKLQQNEGFIQEITSVLRL